MVDSATAAERSPDVNPAPGSTAVLDATELQHALNRQLSPEWYLKGQKLQRDWQVADSTVGAGQPFNAFATATDFIARLTSVARQLSHQLDVHFEQPDHVNVALYTRTQKSIRITKADVKLAVAIDALPPPPLSEQHRTRQQVKAEQSKTSHWHPVLIDFPAYILTPRLKLRPYKQQGDGPTMHELVHASLREFQPFMSWTSPPPTLELCEVATRQLHAKWLDRSDISWLIEDRNSGTAVGSAGVHWMTWDSDVISCNVGYSMHTQHAGRGYATEAANAMVRFAYKYISQAQKPLRVEIRCSEKNAGSRKVAERLGFELDRTEYTSIMWTVPLPLQINVISGVDKLPPLEVEFVHG